MSVKLVQMRFGLKIDSDFDTIESAAYYAVQDVVSNNAAPQEIYENDKLIWKNGNLFDDSYNQLRKLAKWKEDW